MIIKEQGQEVVKHGGTLQACRGVQQKILPLATRGTV